MTAKNRTSLRVIAFPGAPNLPTFAAIDHGFFEDAGLDVSLAITPSSIHQAEKVAAGEFDIAFTAFDNVVAYGEGQGAVSVDPQYCVIMGATQLELSLVVAPDVKSYEDLKGRSIALDALSTGFAFVLFDMMEKAGLRRDDVSFEAVGATPQRWKSVKEGEHAGTLTIEPFTSIARRAGFNVLDVSSNHYDSYQGGVVAAPRPYVAANAATIESFIGGYLRGLEWTLDPANREAAEALLLSKMSDIQPAAIGAVMQSVTSARSGLTPKAAILREGMARVLALRSRYGSGDGELADIDRYLELSAYEAVLAEHDRGGRASTALA